MHIRCRRNPRIRPGWAPLVTAAVLTGILNGRATAVNRVTAAHEEEGRPARLGMFLENAERLGNAVTVRTPGARFTLVDKGAVSVRGRIPVSRAVASLRFEPPPEEPWVAGDADEDRAVVTVPGVEVEIHGDSLAQVRAREPRRLIVSACFSPEYHAAKDAARLLADEQGGFGIYPVGGDVTLSREDLRLARETQGPPHPVLVYDLARGAELWISIFPPRPADPRRLPQSIAHEGHAAPFPDAAYPSTAIVEDAARHCQIFALHAYFWEEAPDEVKPTEGKYVGRRCSWLTPRHEPADPVRWTRLVEDVHRCGMKLVVYLSPYYSTAPDIFAEMRRVLDAYDVDGFYFDGVSMDLRRSYEVLRRAREILGDDRILYVHASSDPFRSMTLFCPTLDAYADFVLRGEAGRGGLPLDTFLRYVVSGWNLGNDVGVWCYYGSNGEPGSATGVPSPEHIEAALRNHGRIWRRSGWADRATGPAGDGAGRGGTSSGGGGDIASFDRLYGPGLEALVRREAREGKLRIAEPKGSR